jgi:large subunit ribosomal protein L25
MLSITAEPRTVFGKKLKDLRKSGKIPAVAYGAKEASIPLSLNAKEFGKVFAEAGETGVVSLRVGTDDKDILIHDVALDPVSHLPIHADLYVLEKGKKVEVAVPLLFTGVSLAVKSLGGTLVKVLHEVPVRALPKDLPHDFTISLELLTNLDSLILVKDISVPSGVTVLASAEDIVASVSGPRDESTLETVDTPVDFSQIEVEKRGKKEEETPSEGE